MDLESPEGSDVETVSGRTETHGCSWSEDVLGVSIILVIRECTYTDRTGDLVVSHVQDLRDGTYETTKAETGIKNRICDIGQDDVLSSSASISQSLTGLRIYLPGTETTEGREHTHRTECNETENSDLAISILTPSKESQPT